MYYEKGKEFVKENKPAQSSSDEKDKQQEILKLIEKLSDLHKSGVLSDAEFEAKKTELLERL